ncbi:MAG: class I SAM-dependent methyltransferase [Acidobacteria bacterium]|nr:class I SAM-dependent methyltransferase [Acidobacteriota bacterium]
MSWPILDRALVRTGLLPSCYMWPNPFKIVEFQALLDGVRIAPTDAILDVGCGGGPQAFVLARRAGRIVGIDPAPSQIERARRLARTWAPGRDLELRCTTIERAGFAPRTFDKVFSFSVLEHIPNRDETLAVIADVLRPGGALIFSCDSMATMADPARRARHQAEHAVLTYFTPPELRGMLEARGFGQIRIRPLFRSPYALRTFEAAVDRGLGFGRYAKFPALARLRFEEWRHRRCADGLFLLVHAVKQP